MILVACALIINKQNKLFAARRSSKMSLPLKWEFPGGKVEPNESVEHCLIREIREELNVEIEIVKELPANKHSYSSITIQLNPFICKIVRGKVILSEHMEFKWLSADELLDLDWAEADIPILKYYLTTLNAIS